MDPPPWACSCLASTVTSIRTWKQRPKSKTPWGSKVLGVPQVNHHAKSIECAECLEGKSENPLFRCLNAPCWMKVGCTFLIPPGHLLTTSTTSTKTASETAVPCPGVADVVLEQKSSARPPRPELLHRCRSPWDEGFEHLSKCLSASSAVVLIDVKS